jgi:predicted Zn finger-like uncharacterized protein
MKISCPKCDASGTIPDHEVPESGRFINCPRCHEGFTITKPRSGNDVYLVDTCPSCGFSTFGDETFSNCPKCGVVIKTCIERQREEQRLKHNQELLGKKYNNTETPPTPQEAFATPVTDFIDNLHPVNLIGWGTAAVATIVLLFGIWGIIGYDGSKIQNQLMEDGGKKVSGFSVFLHFGPLHWIKLLYGICSLVISVLFMKRLKVALQAMRALVSGTIVLMPLLYSISFIYWVMEPIPHTISGYLIEIMNILFMSTLVGVPLYMLERYLHKQKITSVVKL